MAWNAADTAPDARERSVAQLNQLLADGWRMVSSQPMGGGPGGGAGWGHTWFASLVILERDRDAG